MVQYLNIYRLFITYLSLLPPPPSPKEKGFKQVPVKANPPDVREEGGSLMPLDFFTGSELKQ